jgi:hypothetical protein
MTNRRITRLSVVGMLASICAVLVVAATAGAAPPSVSTTHVDFGFVDSVDCDFDVAVHITGTDTAVTRVVGGDVYDFHAFGGGFTTLTNLDTEESITFNISGPGRFIFGEDGSFRLTGTGTALFAQEEEPGIQWFKGRYDLQIDAEGNATFTTTGTFVDMCAALTD